MGNFVNAANRVIVPLPKAREGKSGQYRVTHRLIAGPDRKIWKKVPQKITVPDVNRDKGENVR